MQRAHGGLAELVSADVRTPVHKPRTMSFAEAAGLPLAGLTAYRAVVRALRVRQGETLLVHGAAGGVGSLAAQIGRARGARVVGTASARDHAYLRSLGVLPVAYGEGVAQRVLGVPAGADAVLDTVGGGTLVSAAGTVRPGGRVASVAETGLPGVVPVFCRLGGDDLKAVAELADAGRLRVRVGATFPLERAAEAQGVLAAGGTRGNVVVAMGADPPRGRPWGSAGAPYGRRGRRPPCPAAPDAG
ncbi:NADP-dependent oxidoreductase [Streptomyces sp. Ru62]|uniref:NADP-dependent oxidoreductase n=1 Tax=Streptomyces sp. Ru62 TaxID=2080745 RepID=UPI0021563FFC|nr:NADP-dependent oxidoreductase [Streptomyces sp. Ru62]